MKKISILCALLLTTILFNSCDSNANETFDHWYTYIYSKNTKLKETWLKKAYHDDDLSEIEFTVCKKSGLTGSSSGIIFGVTDFYSPAYKFVVDSNGYYNFCTIDFDPGINGIYQIEEHNETLIKSGPSELLVDGLGEKNAITIKLVDEEADGTYDIRIYANMSDLGDDSIYEINYKGTGAYAQLPSNSLKNIYFTTFMGEGEGSPSLPLNVQFTVPDDTDEEPETDYVYGWQDGTAGGADENYRVFYCSEKRYYSTIYPESITDSVKVTAMVNQSAIVTMIKDSGAFNYGYGFSFCHDTVTDAGDTYYLFAIDTSGYYTVRKINTPESDEDKQIIQMVGWTKNAKLLTGLGAANTIVVRLSAVNTGFRYDFWINPADPQNPAGDADATFTDLNDESDGDPFSTGTVKFYPGIGSSNLEDFPYNPVKYRYKYSAVTN